MPRQVLLTTEALTDLRQAKGWYDAKRFGLSAALCDELEDALSQIAEHPLRWPFVVGEARRFRLNRFPFSIPYLVVDEHIIVLGVLQGARNPEILYRRLHKYGGETKEE